MDNSKSSNGLCRLCASLFFSKSGFFLFGDDHIANKIELYLQIQMIQDDFLPKNICATCLSKIETFHQFAENARKIQHSFNVYSDANIYEPHQEEILINRIETLGKVDTNNLFAKEEQQFNLNSENFGSVFNKELCNTQDSFLSLFPSTIMPAQNLDNVLIVPSENTKNRNLTMSEYKEPNARGSNGESSYTSIIKPIDMKHLTTPSNSQPNLFNLPNASSNLFNSSSPIILDCCYSDDVMGSGYLDISTYPDMSEIEDININYKNSIKFEIGKQCGDPPSFDVADTSFVSLDIGPTSNKPALTDQNEYFNNFEYKHKDAIKYPDFDLMREIHLNINGIGSQTPCSITSEQSENQGTPPININLTNGTHDMAKCSLPMSSEDKQLFLPSLQTDANNFTAMFDSWNNENMPAQLSETNSKMPEQYYEKNTMETFCTPANTPTSEAVTYDVIYLGEDVYANTNESIKQVANTNGADNSVLRNRLLNMQERNDREAQLQVITLTEDTNNINTPVISETSEMVMPVEVNNTLNYPNNTPCDSSPPQSMSSHSTLSETVSKTPTIQCKSLDKIIKDMQTTQPSIQCKSLDKIIKDMKIANRLSKLQRQSSVSSDSSINGISNKNLAIVPNNRLIKRNKNSSRKNRKYEERKESNDTTEPLLETHANNKDKAQVGINSIESSDPSSMSTEIAEPFEVNVIRTGTNSYTIQNVNVINGINSENSKPSHVNETQQNQTEERPNIVKAHVDEARCIKKRIIDLKKSETKSKCENNIRNPMDQLSTSNNENTLDKQKERKDEDSGHNKLNRELTHIKCDKCFEVYPFKKTFDDHYQSVHKSPPIYTCLCCSKSTSFYATFKSHCYRRNNLNRYRCDYPNCRKNFNSKSGVETHIKYVHLKLGTPKYVCEVCGSVFPSTIQLNSHLPCKLTDPIVFVCQTCSKILSSAVALKHHVRRVHSEHSYICDICATPFHMKYNLVQHIKTHTSTRPYSCSHCGKSYFERSHLRRHQQKHNTTCNFPCRHCPKSFKSKELRRLHEKTHAPRLPAQCDFCPKSFLTMTKLKEHNNIHTGERPFTCKFCDLSFSNYPNWYKHMKRKHPDFPYTSLKIALSGASQQSNRDVNSTEPAQEIAPDSSPLVDISSNTLYYYC